MKIPAYLLLILLLVACSEVKEPENTETTEFKTASYVAEGDSMCYGLACEGCNDTLLVFLPDKGGDPIDYNIIPAKQEGRVFGRPQIGDRIAVLIDPADSTCLLSVINLEQINGTWFYMQLPTLRKRSEVDSIAAAEREKVMTEEQKERRDSMRQSFMKPIEYAYTFKRDFTVKTAGGPPRVSSLDRRSPVVYPPMKRYTEWHVHNGKLVFSYLKRWEGGLDSMELYNDTAEFISLRRDSMVLRFADHIQRFKLKPDSIE